MSCTSNTLCTSWVINICKWVQRNWSFQNSLKKTGQTFRHSHFNLFVFFPFTAHFCPFVIFVFVKSVSDCLSVYRFWVVIKKDCTWLSQQPGLVQTVPVSDLLIKRLTQSVVSEGHRVIRIIHQNANINLISWSDTTEIISTGFPLNF